MIITDPFVARATRAFLVPVAFSAICYFLISVVARRHSSTPRQLYFRRLFLMFVVLVVWWVFYPMLSASAFAGNWADPHNAERYTLWMAKRSGTAYGLQAVWAWVIVALIGRPKLRRDISPQPGSSPVSNLRLNSGLAEL